jgi:hypothetical protein
VHGHLFDVATYTIYTTYLLSNATAINLAFDQPLPGNGVYYLVRYAACASWQTTIGAEPMRDVQLP